MTTISDAKRITPTFTRSEGELFVDYQAAFDTNVIGYFATYHQAENALNDYVLGLFEAGLIGGPDYPEPDTIPGADPSPGRSYHFTRQQLEQALNGAIEMFIELFDDRDPDSCRAAAVDEIMQGLDADRELAAWIRPSGCACKSWWPKCAASITVARSARQRPAACGLRSLPTRASRSDKWRGILASARRPRTAPCGGSTHSAISAGIAPNTAVPGPSSCPFISSGKVVIAHEMVDRTE